ncbi:hypothetical protein PG996_000313 [Apiospora saccharicola]|uniref:Uncharacterized protein n=1 Tax=Apiospora saccharicola TaxID=335842 RepID=A0ABR1WEU3_9PEZI
MKGFDKQHVPSDTDPDHLSIYTDAAGSIFGKDTKYWSGSSTLGDFAPNIVNPHNFAVELEGDCVYPPLTPNFLQMAMAQLAFARGAEPEVRYLERIRGILEKMTLDDFELLVDELDPDWVPKGSLWREFVQFQFRAGIMIGKREVAAAMLNRLNLEQGFHTEASDNSDNPVQRILADILEETPGFDTMSRGAAPKTLNQRAEASKYLQSQKTAVFSVLRTGAHAQAVRTPSMRTWDGQMPYSWQKNEDLSQERSEMSVVEDEEDMKLAQMLGHGL